MHRPKEQALTQTDRDLRDEAVARLRKHLPLSVAGRELFSNANLLEHPLYGMIRSEPVKGSV